MTDHKILMDILLDNYPVSEKNSALAEVLTEVAEDLALLRALQSVGVENWSGYGYACEILDGSDNNS